MGMEKNVADLKEEKDTLKGLKHEAFQLAAHRVNFMEYLKACREALTKRQDELGSRSDDALAAMRLSMTGDLLVRIEEYLVMAAEMKPTIEEVIKQLGHAEECVSMVEQNLKLLEVLEAFVPLGNKFNSSQQGVQQMGQILGLVMGDGPLPGQPNITADPTDGPTVDVNPTSDPTSDQPTDPPTPDAPVDPTTPVIIDPVAPVDPSVPTEPVITPAPDSTDPSAPVAPVIAPDPTVAPSTDQTTPSANPSAPVTLDSEGAPGTVPVSTVSQDSTPPVDASAPVAAPVDSSTPAAPVEDSAVPTTTVDPAVTSAPVTN